MMKSDNTIESNESTEDRDRRNRELNEKKIFEMECESPKFKVDRKREESRWDNLIFIDVQFYINDFLFKEEFLWDKKINSPSQIKEFCCYLLRENTMSKEKNYTGLCQGINKFSYDFLECCAEYMTRKIFEEIKFYEKFQPFALFRNGVFGSGCGIENEHLININLDISAEYTTFKDSFQWDIINEENIPEDFSSTIVKEFNLPNEYINLIALGIRKQIKEHVFNTMGSLTEIFINLKENFYNKSQNGLSTATLSHDKISYSLHSEEKKLNSINTKTLFATYNTNTLNQKFKPLYKYQSEINNKFSKIDNKLSGVVPFLFEYKLEQQLGRKSSRKIEKEFKPYFIRNQIKKKDKKQRANSYLMHSNLTNSKYDSATKSIDARNTNNNVSIINENIIQISKEVLKYKDYFELIVIEKKDIREFLSDLNI